MIDALRFDAVTAGYGGEPVLRDLSFSVGAGEIVAVLGPNGTGKTTLVRLACRSVAPDSGRIELFGRDLAMLEARERARQVAVVPQESRPAFDFTVEEMVRMGRTPHLRLLGLETSRDRAGVDEALRRTGIAALANRNLGSLSGGERQRAVLARALAQEPRLLLLDEPTAFLDLKHRLALYDLLRRLNRETSLTVVVASHDLDLAARHCDRLIFLSEGAVFADGAPVDVLTPGVLRQVYGVVADVRIDAATGRPHVVPLSPCVPAS